MRSQRFRRSRKRKRRRVRVLNKVPKQKAMPVASVPQGWDADLSVV